MTGGKERRFGVTMQTLLLLLLNGIGALTLFFGTRYLDGMSSNIKDATVKMEALYAQHEQRLDEHDGRLTMLETEIKVPPMRYLKTLPKPTAQPNQN